MGDLLQPWHLIIVFGFLVMAGLFFLPAIFYILTLQNALKKCAPESRTIDPGLIWLYLIPVVNFIFSFFIVLGVAKTLRNEFNRRSVFVADPTPGQAIGIAMCVCMCCSIIPVLGVLAWLAHLVLWIIYWSKIAGYSRTLDFQPQVVSSPNIA